MIKILQNVLNISKLNLGYSLYKRCVWIHMVSMRDGSIFLNNSFQKRIFTMTYRNRYNWTTKKMRTQMTYIFLLGHKTLRIPENLELKNEYKQKRNRIISDLRNAKITYYSNELDLQKKIYKKKMETSKNHYW